MTHVDDGPLSARLGEIRPDANSVELQRLRKEAAALLGIASAPPPTHQRFEIIRRLGAGGMGVVYLARDHRLRRDVALKFLRPAALGIGSPEEHRRTLREEARAAAAISHPNLVEVFDVGEIDGQVFMAMNDVRGERLSVWCRDGRPAKQVVHVFEQIARGLHALHEAGLAHGDLKPANVIVGEGGHATLVDYGLARRHHADTLDDAGESARAGGTPGYLAPELVAGEPASPASDQYAFGVALKEALAHVHRAPPHHLDDVARRTTASDPALRFASMLATANALRPPRRRSTRMALLAAAAVLVVGAGASSVWAGRAEPRDTAQSAKASDEAAALLDEGRAARFEGRYAAAETTLADAFSVAQRDGDALIQARAASALVAITGALAGRPLDAQQWERHAEAALARLGNPPSEQATHLASRAESALANADSAAAVDLARQSLALDSDPATMRILGSALEERGEYDEAMAWHLEALSLLSRDDPRAATVLMALGKVHHSRWDFDQARLLYEEALSIYEATIGPDHPQTAIVVARLGLVAGASGDLTTAERNHRRALEIRRSALGPNHVAVAEVLTFLGGVLKRQRRLAEARVCYEKAIAIIEAELGSDNGQLAVTLGGLAGVLVRSGDVAEASEVLERTVEIRRRTRGKRHPRVAMDLSMLADVQRLRGQFDDALENESDALSIRAEALGEDHPLTARSRDRIEAIESQRGR